MNCLIFYLMQNMRNIYFFACISVSGNILTGGDELRMVGPGVWNNMRNTVHHIARRKWRKTEHWI